MLSYIYLPGKIRGDDHRYTYFILCLFSYKTYRSGRSRNETFNKYDFDFIIPTRTDICKCRVPQDPILTAFELSWELRRLSALEHEFKTEYQELRAQCQEFATALLDHTRTSHELQVDGNRSLIYCKI